MRTRTPLRRWAALAVTTAVAALIPLAGIAQAADGIPPATLGATIDYFDDVYAGLGPDSVFETVTIERFEYILKTKPGSFAFLIGDPGNPSTQATIGHIDAVARSLGVERIYNFTPKLDGDTLDVWDLSASGLRTGTSPDPAGGNRAGQGLAQYEALGNRLLTDYLNRDTETQFTMDEATDPYLFVYDKDRTVEGEEDRIVAALSGARTAEDLDSAPEQDAYRAEVAAVLGSVDDLATNTQFEFNRDEHNRRHYERYVRHADPETEADRLARYGGDIFDESDAADGFRIETITYPELLHLVNQPGDFALLFGGTWCHNTAAIIKDTNRLAQEQGIRTVYNFDFSLASTGNGGGDALHIRDNALADEVGGQVIRPSHLYGDLVNDYLTNAVTQYRKNDDPGPGGTNFVAYYPGGDTTLPLAEARKIQVGHVLSYNRDRVNVLGEPEPVIDQAIRHNDNGGNTEHMTEWWFVAGRDLPAGDPALRGALNPASEAGSNQLQSQRAFAKEGIDEIETVLRGFSATDLASTVTVDGIADGEELLVGETPTLDVTVAADGFAPFISLHTANQNAAPPEAPETGKPRGVVGLFDGETLLADARLSRQGTASLTVPALPVGDQELAVRYLGRGDLISPSQAVVTFSVVGEPSTTTLSGPALLFYGQPGTFEATVSPEVAPEGEDPVAEVTGTVRLDGLPGGPVEAAIVDGAAQFEVPTTTPSGVYELAASYLGDESYGLSTSALRSLRVFKDSFLFAHAAPQQFETAGTVVVELVSSRIQPVPGQVTVAIDDAAFTQTVDLADGRASVALPADLAVGTHEVTVAYLGSPEVEAEVRSIVFTVTEQPIPLPAFSDVPPTHLFYDDIVWLVQSGVGSGYPDNTFRPGDPVTRQAAASFLYRLSGSPEFTPPETPSFTDVPTTHIFYKEVEWLVDSDIASGFADGTFRPTSVVTRQAVASFLYRLSGSPEASLPATPTFTDVPDGHLFRTPIEWLVSHEITAGYADNTFRPDNVVSRQGAAALLHNYDTNV